MTDTVPISKPEAELLEALPPVRTRLMAMAQRGLERSCAPNPPPERPTKDGVNVTRTATHVVQDFGRLVVWQRYTPAEARALALELLAQARALDPLHGVHPGCAKCLFAPGEAPCGRCGRCGMDCSCYL